MDIHQYKKTSWHFISTFKTCILFHKSDCNYMHKVYKTKKWLSSWVHWVSLVILMT